ncbi:type II toxin-antitoxin system PemK/MazF family toxin [Acetobacter aceti]|uniref:mRNA-degrading endonuclease n=1 Tax=Acetobacter aceti TaxID=435 RepID=A0A6S6PF51_ACEAC|nr:type II toxin-antitoxin system PemK/MazF family toxin [Acetobacter aceti]BCI65999.1 mRNA-degrading endonuclease [Acetobacter aceti]
MAYAPERGDIFLLNLSPQAGSEMAGEHRVLVLSERAFNVGTGCFMACPITTKIKGSPFEVVIPSGLKAHGCVLASEVRTLDYIARGARFLEKAPASLIDDVTGLVATIIGL